MLSYMLKGSAVSIILLGLVILFKEDPNVIASLFSVIPVSIYAILKKRKRGKLNKASTIWSAISIFFICAVASTYFPQVVVVFIIGFTFTGLFMLFNDD